MKAEDLMIGDWVHSISTIHNVSFPDNGVIQDEGYTTIHTPIKITTVSENCVSYYSNKLELYITLSSEDIEPIPLTPEILEKNGFGCDRNDGYAILRLEDNSELLYYFHEYKLTRFYKSEIIFRCQCVYAHQLQRALKLCGIDKEIIV
jgi:hypothetical protein